MSHGLFILAESDPTVKLIIGLLIAVGWVIVQVFGALSKKPDKRLPPPAPTPPSAERLPDSDRPPLRQVPVPAPAPPRLQRTKPKQRPKPPAPRPVATYQPPSPLAESARQAAERVIPTRATVPQRQSLPRRQTLRTLLQPQNLKSAFILNEILQPPVSPRSPQNGPGS